MRTQFPCNLFAYSLFLSLVAAPLAAQTWHGPAGYLSAADSLLDLSGASGAVFLEDFEDGMLNTKGLAIAGNVVPPGPITDSVDADDGAIDGFGIAGHSYFTGSGSTGLTATFDAVALGGFPTSVGLVWTDGAGTATFQAFDSTGASLGTIGPVSIGASSMWTGETDEDRFFGVTHSAGISAVKISNTQGGIEIDHVQYVVPAAMCAPDLGFQGPGTAVATLCGKGLNAGECRDYQINGAPSSANGVLLISVDGFANVPVLGGTLASFGGFIVQAPIVASSSGGVTIPFVGAPPPALNLAFQSVFLDASLPFGLAFTNAVLAEYGQ